MREPKPSNLSARLVKPIRLDEYRGFTIALCRIPSGERQGDHQATAIPSAVRSKAPSFYANHRFKWYVINCVKEMVDDHLEGNPSVRIRTRRRNG